LTWLSALTLSLVICQPMEYQWNPYIPGGGHCGNIIRSYQMICVPNIVTDIMLLVLPLPALYKLQVNAVTKVGLFATFLIGSV
jgi:hypothetical protein